ncbi:hypothetical protein D1872_267490 [compost metagenome]
MTDLSPKQLQTRGVAALLDPLDRVRQRIGNDRRSAVLKVDCVHIADQLQHFGRSDVIRQPAAKLGRDVKLPVTVSSSSSKPRRNGAGGKAAGKLLFPGSGRTKRNLLLQNRTTATVYIMSFIHQQHLPMRRFPRQLIAGKNPRRSGPDNDYIVFIHQFNFLLRLVMVCRKRKKIPDFE